MGGGHARTHPRACRPQAASATRARIPRRGGGEAVTIRRDRDVHATAVVGERRPREQSGPAADTGASPSAQDAAAGGPAGSSPTRARGCARHRPTVPRHGPPRTPRQNGHTHRGKGGHTPLGARAPRRDARGPTLTTHPRGEVWSAPMPGHLGCGGTRAGSALTRARNPRASDAGRRRRRPLHVNPTRAASGQRLQRLAGHVGGKRACAVAAPPPQLGGEGREICASPCALRLRQPAGRL